MAMDTAFDAGPPAPGGIPAHLVGFITALRAKGVSVGPAQTVDAGRVLTVLDPLDRDVLREGLAAALLHRPVHRETFDALFDLWFPPVLGLRGPDAADDDDAGLELPTDPQGQVDLDGLEAMLAELLADDTPEGRARLEELIGQMVDQLGRYDGMSGESFSAYQTLRGLDGNAILDKLLGGMLGPREDGVQTDRLAGEVLLRTAIERVNRLRRMVDTETRRRVAERHGRDRVAAYAVPQSAEEIDFLRASDADLIKLRQTMVPLARALATRLAARRRRARAGTIDLRRTLRKSMSTGGVPIDLVLAKPRAARPELVVLCDVSGSVAGFSHFTLQLVHVLREQFSKVRIFAFVDTTDEVTDYFTAGADLGVAMAQMVREARLITYDGHSDYGHALGGLAEEFAHALTPRASVLILGDGRNNYRDPNYAALERIRDAVRQTHWLNPEPTSQWGTGDSVALEYGRIVEMHECRNAEQLTAVVAQLLPV